MNFKHLFWLYKSKENKQGEAPLYLRITALDGSVTNISTGYFLKKSDWDVDRKQIKGKTEIASTINNYLGITTAKLIQIQNELTVSNATDVTAGLIKNHLLGISSKKKTLLEVFNYHNQLVKEKVGNSLVEDTLKQYEVTQRKVVAFLKHCYNTSDYILENLSHKFLTDFESYLKNHDGLSSNSAMKKLTQLKTVIKVAIANEWTNKNPFGNFKCVYKNPKREVLTKTELEHLMSKTFGTDRLNIVKDIFVFCCYTGLRYSDVLRLKPSNIITGIDGKKWLSIDTKKTNERCNIPLFEQALSLIDKYSSHPLCLNKKVVFPVKSNQKMNEYLKEIAEIMGINKKLHFHLSRHTFATTVMLENDYTLESVGKILGQRSIRTTQIYGKMTDKRLSNEMQKNRFKIEIMN